MEAYYLIIMGRGSIIKNFDSIWLLSVLSIHHKFGKWGRADIKSPFRRPVLVSTHAILFHGKFPVVFIIFCFGRLGFFK